MHDDLRHGLSWPWGQRPCQEVRHLDQRLGRGAEGRGEGPDLGRAQQEVLAAQGAAQAAADEERAEVGGRGEAPEMVRDSALRRAEVRDYADNFRSLATEVINERLGKG